MIVNRDIVIISLQAWDIGIGSNCKDIARELSKYNRVLYVNSPLDRMTKLRKRSLPSVKRRIDIINGKSEDLVPISDNLWTLFPRTTLESVSRLPWNWLFDKLNLINNRRFATQILLAIKRLHLSDYILFNDGNMFRGLYMNELLHPRLSVYYYRDNFMAMDFWKVQGHRIQPAIMAKSDIVMANSAYLGKDAQKHNPNTYVVGQGFDHHVYNRQNSDPCPEDIRSIPHPVIGYTGALLSLRLDPGIIRHIAQIHPDWSIVLVGPEDETFRDSDLHRIPNIYFLGQKDPSLIPSYIKQFDVAINPQNLNELTLGNYPRKVDEYLGMGKPVVATKTEFMSMFSHITSLAESHEDYATLIEAALKDNSPELEVRREAYAMTHSWESNVAGISEILDKQMNYTQQ
ncbi:MAG: glycosyltransferase [Bacteroidetes bacterium]|nr:glycosyltransferase [Bacteroidota bacterium]